MSKKTEGPTHQEVRVKLEMAITIRTCHDAARIAEIIENGARRAWPNMPGSILHLSYAEESAIYSGEGAEVVLIEGGVGQDWRKIIATAEEGRKAKAQKTEGGAE